MDLNRQPLPALGFIGAGRVARALAWAAAAAGYPVVAVTSRDPASAARLAETLNGATVCQDAQAVVDASDIAWLTVSDDAIESVARLVRVPAGKALVHCSGASPVSWLEASCEAGALAGGFHPLCLFSGLPTDSARLPGCSIAIDAADALREQLHDLAAALGCHALSVPREQRMLYHAAANYGASFALCGLYEAVSLWRSIGLSEQETLNALLPMLEGTLAAARANGLSGALAGSISRGDAKVVTQQLETLAEHGADHAALYAAMSRRAVALARRRRQPPPSLDAIEAALNKAG